MNDENEALRTQIASLNTLCAGLVAAHTQTARLLGQVCAELHVLRGGLADSWAGMNCVPAEQVRATLDIESRRLRAEKDREIIDALMKTGLFKEWPKDDPRWDQPERS